MKNPLYGMFVTIIGMVLVWLIVCVTVGLPRW